MAIANQFSHVLSSTTVLGVALIASGLLSTGCQHPADPARRHLAEGKSVRAVHLYESAARRHPEDQTIRRELEQARVEAARHLAEQSAGAADAGDYGEAIGLAQLAGRYDPAQRELEESSRRRQAAVFLDRGRQMLEESNLRGARTMHDRAERAAPNFDGLEAFHQQLIRAEADQAAEKVHQHLSRGEFAAAERLAGQASDLDPSRASIADLPLEVDRARRAQQFNRGAPALRRALDAGRLAEARQHLDALSRLNVEHERLDELAAMVEQQGEQVDELRREATAAADSGDYEHAMRLIARAEGLAKDVPEINEVGQAIQRQREAASAIERAEIALERGDLETAGRLLNHASEIRLDDELAERRALLSAEYHRLAFDSAIERDDPIAALSHLTPLRRHTDNPELAGMRAELEQQAVQAALRDADRHHSTGHHDEAIAVLDRAMRHVHDPELTQRRSAIAAERLVALAAEAEQAGQYDLARRRYLEAMKYGEVRLAIAGRLSDVEVLADMEQKLEQTQSELQQTRQTLQQRDHRVSQLEGQLASRSSELDDLEQQVQQLAWELEHARYHRPPFNRGVHIRHHRPGHRLHGPAGGIHRFDRGRDDRHRRHWNYWWYDH